LIWCPKRRKPVLIKNIKKRLEEIIREKAREIQVEIIAFEIKPDHIHLFVSSPSPRVTVHKIVKAFKGLSSRILRKEFPHL